MHLVNPFHLDVPFVLLAIACTLAAANFTFVFLDNLGARWRLSACLAAATVAAGFARLVAPQDAVPLNNTLLVLSVVFLLATAKSLFDRYLAYRWVHFNDH